jgi:hypothetical protein
LRHCIGSFSLRAEFILSVELTFQADRREIARQAMRGHASVMEVGISCDHGRMIGHDRKVM